MLRWLIHSGCGDFLVWYTHNPVMSQAGHEHSEMNGTLLWRLIYYFTTSRFWYYYYIVCPCYPYDTNCTCNATDSWGKPLVTGWLWNTCTYCFSIMHNTQTIRGLPIRSLIRLFWWRSACIAIAWATIGTLEGETRIIKSPVKCVDDSSYLGKSNNHTIN